MLRKLSLLVGAATLVVLQGCAGFAANKIPDVTAEQLRPASEQKTRVFSRWSFGTDATDSTMRAASSAVFKKRFDDALLAADCCVIVEGPGDADLVIDATAHDETNKAALIGAFITGLSLYTIPSWVTIKAHVTANTDKGGVKGTYDASDSMTMVQWLPMLFAFPFANPFPMEKELTDNVMRNIILKMKQDGLLP